MLSNFVLIDQTFFCGQPVAMRTSACAASTKPPFNPVQPKPVGQSGVPWQHCATPLSTQTGSEPRSCPKCREHQQHHTRCVSVFYINIPQRFCCSSQIQLSWSEQYIIRYFLPKVTFRIATIVLAVSLLCLMLPFRSSEALCRPHTAWAEVQGEEENLQERSIPKRYTARRWVTDQAFPRMKLVNHLSCSCILNMLDTSLQICPLHQSHLLKMRSTVLK